MPHQHDNEACPHHHHEVHAGGEQMHHEHSDLMASFLGLLGDFNHNGLCVGHFDNVLLAKTESSIKVPQADLLVPFNLFAAEVQFSDLGNNTEAEILDFIAPPDLRFDQPEKSGTSHRGPPVS